MITVMISSFSSFLRCPFSDVRLGPDSLQDLAFGSCVPPVAAPRVATRVSGRRRLPTSWAQRRRRQNPIEAPGSRQQGRSTKDFEGVRSRYRCLRKKHSSREEDPLEDKLLECQIGGWRAVSAAGLQRPCSPERSVFITDAGRSRTAPYIYIYTLYIYIYIYIHMYMYLNL